MNRVGANLSAAIAAALVGTFLAASVGASAVQAAETPVRVLVTSFEKFSGAPENASRVMVRAFMKSAPELEAESITIRHVLLPVVYGAAEKKLIDAISEFHPDVMISFGEAGRGEFQIEQAARNLDDTPTADNAGVVHEGVRIIDEGPSSLETSLPVGEIVEAISRVGKSAAPSSDAGGFLCNHVFYHVMNQAQLLETAGHPVVAGFVHVPLREDPFTYPAWGREHAGVIGAVVRQSVNAWRLKTKSPGAGH